MNRTVDLGVSFETTPARRRSKSSIAKAVLDALEPRRLMAGENPYDLIITQTSTGNEGEVVYYDLDFANAPYLPPHIINIDNGAGWSIGAEPNIDFTWNGTVASLPVLAADDDLETSVTISYYDGLDDNWWYWNPDVDNVAPTGSLSNNGPIKAGQAAIVAITGPNDPSPTDTSAGFHYTFAIDTGDLADSYAEAGTSISARFPSLSKGVHVIHARIFDKDDGYSQYYTNVTVGFGAYESQFTTRNRPPADGMDYLYFEAQNNVAGNWMYDRRIPSKVTYAVDQAMETAGGRLMLDPEWDIFSEGNEFPFEINEDTVADYLWNIAEMREYAINEYGTDIQIGVYQHAGGALDVFPEYNGYAIENGYKDDPADTLPTNWDSIAEDYLPLLQDMVNAVDFVSPLFYTLSVEPEEWQLRAEEYIEQAKTWGKPVIPLMQPGYESFVYESPYGQLPAEYWKMQLDTAGRLADGLIVWTGFSEDWNLTNGVNPEPWYVALEAFNAATPSGLTAPSSVTLSSSGARLTWTDNSSGESAFRIEKQAYGSGTWEYAGIVTANVEVWDDPMFRSGYNYLYRVSAVDRYAADTGTSSATGYTGGGTDRLAVSRNEPEFADAGADPIHGHRRFASYVWATNSVDEEIFFDNVDFGAGADQVVLGICSDYYWSGGTPVGYYKGVVDIYVDYGTINEDHLGTIELEPGPQVWLIQPQSAEIDFVSGVHDLTFVFSPHASSPGPTAGQWYGAMFDWFAFNHAPAPVTGLTASISSGNVLLNWTGHGHGTDGSYIIERTTNQMDESSWSVIDTEATTTYTHYDTFDSDVVYYYRVIAENAYGESVPSKPVPISFTSSSLGVFTNASHFGNSTYAGANGLHSASSSNYIIHTSDTGYARGAEEGQNYFFAYKTIAANTDFSLVTQVIAGAGWDSAGLMMRTTLNDTGPTYDPFVSVGIEHYEEAGVAVHRPAYGTSYFSRYAYGAEEYQSTYWVKLERVSGSVQAYKSEDGSTWTAWDVPNSISGAVYVGIYAGRRPDSLYEVATVEFDNLSF